MSSGPKIIPDELFKQAGIDRKSLKPVRCVLGKPSKLKENLRRMFRIIDEQDAIGRFKWYNLPCNITGEELERMLYYKGQLCFFYEPNMDQFFFMPYALDGTIDFYGRFNTIHPVPMANGSTEEEKKRFASQMEVLSKIKREVQYGINIKPVDPKKVCVLLHDYTKQMSETIIPRQQVNDAIIDVMSDCVPYLRTAMIAGSGVKGIRVNDADQFAEVVDAGRDINEAALKGQIYYPLLGKIEMQELTEGSTTKIQEYQLALQALDNVRLSTFGLENGGAFEKKAHVLQSEMDAVQSNVGIVLQDDLAIRQNFCNIVNSIWNLGIWCEPNEAVNGQDVDGDGKAYADNPDGANSGVDTNTSDKPSEGEK